MFCVLEVLCRRSHRTYLSPLQFICLAHHQIEVAVVVDAGTQTGIIIHKFLFCNLKHKPETFIVRLGTLVQEIHMCGGHTVCCGYRLGQFCRRTAIRLWAFCVQCAHRLWGLARWQCELSVKVTLWCRGTEYVELYIHSQIPGSLRGGVFTL